MTPKDQAEDLVNKFLKVGAQKTYTEVGAYVKYMPYANAQICAMIAVEEIIAETINNYDTIHSIDRVTYWEDVKNEIENL